MSCLFAQIDYETEIQTIFNNNCISCHGNSGGLSLDSYASLMTGGNSGSVIISGDHSNSLLWEKINSGQMPPNGQLSSSNIDLIAAWIDEGALEELNTKNNNALPEIFTLHQNYPNPFNPETMIQFDVPQRVDLILSVYDLLGRKVKTLVQDNLDIGSYSVKWSGLSDTGEMLPSGMYFYELNSSKFHSVKKLILVK